MIPFGSKKKLH